MQKYREKKQNEITQKVKYIMNIYMKHQSIYSVP